MKQVGADLLAQFGEAGEGAGASEGRPDDDEIDAETNLPLRATRSLQECDAAITAAQTRQRVALGLDFDIVMDVDFPRLQELLPREQPLGKVWLAINEKLAEELEVGSFFSFVLLLLCHLFVTQGCCCARPRCGREFTRQVPKCYG